MNASSESTEERITRLHGQGMIDLHFDLPMVLYDNRNRKNVLASHFLPELEAGDIGTVAAAIYIEDQYVPDKALEVALGQVARMYVEVERCDRFAICRSYAEIKRARAQGKIALLIAMEGAEPLGTDRNLLRIFYELGLRVIGLTHARSNAAGSGSVFSPTESSPEGLTGIGIGFDFLEFIYRRWSEDERAKFHQRFPNVHFIPDLLHHGQARNLTARLIERGFNDGQIEKILFRNWMRIFEELL